MENENSRRPSETPERAVQVSDANTERPVRYSPREVLSAVLIYIAALIYTECLFFDDLLKWTGLFLGFVLLFVVTGIVLYRDRKKKRPLKFEDIIWLICLFICAVSLHLDLGRGVWERGHLLLFLHAFGVWWAMSRSSGLLENETGHLLPIDVFRGLFIIPLMNFLLQAKTLVGSLINVIRERKRPDKKNRSRIIWIIFAVIVALILLLSVLYLMGEADDTYGAFLEKLLDCFRFELTEDMFFTMLKIFFSIPVSAYLYGLLGGLYRMDREKLSESLEEIGSLLAALKKVPSVVWTVVIAVFSLFYLMFFILQGKFLFGAFAGVLPEGYTLSSYARQGFFELCKVISLNFVLLWFVTRMAIEDVKVSRPLYIASILLLAESMIFCVIAFSKIFFYIYCLGFTPLRLRSVWLTVVLFAACLSWILSLSGKKMFKIWAIFSAVTLSILAFV